MKLVRFCLLGEAWPVHEGARCPLWTWVGRGEHGSREKWGGETRKWLEAGNSADRRSPREFAEPPAVAGARAIGQ